MRPRVSIITLGVDDLDRALTFYRDGLGLPTRGIVGTEYPHGAVVFFDLVNGQKLAVWSRKDMAHEAKVPLGPRSATEFSLGHLVRSKAEVDALIEQARRGRRSRRDRSAARRVLGRVHRLVSGPRRPPVGNRLEP